MKITFVVLSIMLCLSRSTADEIHEAVRNGNLEKVISILDDQPGTVNDRDDQGMTPLHHAIASGRNEISIVLIERGADTSLKDRRYGANPLHYAAGKGNVEIARILLPQNVDYLQERDKQQKTALHIACEFGHAEMVLYLLEEGADIDARDQLGLTPLMSSCSGWNLDVVRILLEHGADPDAITIYREKEYTALTVAALYGFHEMINYLISLDAEIPESVLELTLRYAVQGNHYPLFEYVQLKGLNLEAFLKDNDDMLYLSAAAGALDIFTSLVRKGLDPYRKDIYGWTVIHHAASGAQLEMIKYLIKDPESDLNARSNRGETAFNVAEFLGREETVRFLRNAGADTSDIRFPEVKGSYMGQDPPGDTPEMFMPGIVSGPYRAHGTVVFAPNGSEAYWSDMIPGAQSVMEMKQTGGEWSAPVRSIMWKDPSISPDGNILIFISRKPIHAGDPGGKENYWYMLRTEDGWTDPEPMDTIINAIDIHWQCSMDSSGNLFFSEFEENMYISEWRSGHYGKPVNLRDYFNNPTLKGHSPFIAPNRDYLIFADDDRLFVSFRRVDNSWTDRIDLGDAINSGAGNGSPRVTSDGKYLFFQSTTGDDRRWGIYWVSADIIKSLAEGLPAL